MVGSDPSRTGRAASFLEILGLWCLAIVQPLLDLIAQNAPFLLHYRSDGIDLVGLARDPGAAGHGGPPLR